MEYVEAILYHKIQDSDFTNMYAIKKPTSGGGQTYIQAAGYSRKELDDMFAQADSVTDTIEYWDGVHPRKLYRFTAFTVGSRQSALIELAPRTGRKDYRISRQNPKNRHPAWQASNGFPQPAVAAPGMGAGKGNYLYEKNYPGIIDNLYILIIKTRLDTGARKYYAAYVDSDKLPARWPAGVGLENIFKKQKNQGILFFSGSYLRFYDDLACPFGSGSAVDSQLGPVTLPPDFNDSAVDAVEYAQQEVTLRADANQVAFHQEEAPSGNTRRKRSAPTAARKDPDYQRRNRNKKAIGDLGEDLALALERRRLTDLGRADLAARIRHVSREEGDGLGYDIQSFDQFGSQFQETYIEVKATTGGKNKAFDISANEVAVSEEKGDHYYIYRFFGLHNEMKEASYYVVRGSVKDNFSLTPVSFQAYPRA